MWGGDERCGGVLLYCEYVVVVMLSSVVCMTER